MIAEIFGRPDCPFCVRAQALAARLAARRDDFQFHYVDIYAAGITKAEMERRTGKPVATVPQIFLDQDHISGFAEFNAYIHTHGLLSD